MSFGLKNTDAKIFAVIFLEKITKTFPNDRHFENVRLSPNLLNELNYFASTSTTVESQDLN